MPLTNWLDTLLGDTRAALLRLLRRPPRTINDLARDLGLTDNAVRLHLAALGRDGLVEQVGTERDTGGKPARTYALTRDAEELFPKAYATVLAGLIQVLVQRHGRDHAIELLRAVGLGLASHVSRSPGVEERVGLAVDALRGVGGDLEVRRTEGGYRLQGYGCPLSAVTADHAEACAVARALVEKFTGLPVAENCDRTGRPRCAFTVEAGRDPVTS